MWLQTGFVALFQQAELQQAELLFIYLFYFFTIWYHIIAISFKDQRNNAYLIFLLYSK